MSKTIIAGGKPLRCLHCGHADFESREVLLNTRGATFFNFDWLNRGATILTCTRCSRIEWFHGEPNEADRDTPSRE